jgi:hypothetical protein
MLKDPEPLARRSQPIPIYRESSTELIKFRMTKKGLLRQPPFLLSAVVRVFFSEVNPVLFYGSFYFRTEHQ